MLNPYESPETTSAKSPETTTASKIDWRGLFRPFEILVCCGIVILLCVATVHRFQFGNFDAYRSSPLVAVEVLGVLGAFGLVPVLLIRSLFLACHGRISGAILNVLLCLLACGAALLAMWIDSPALMYAT